jgi:hypothetical protein
VLDTKVSDLVKQFAPDQAGSVPAFIGDKTLRQAIQTPMIGGQVRSQLTPYLSKLGLNPQDFEKAVNSPPAAPGKRSEGTSDATDFSAQSRTPPGTPENVPLPQPGPRTENRNDAQVDLNMTPQERALYDRHLGNLYGSGGVDNPNGSRSTLYQANVDIDGKSYNIPTVYDGKIVPVDEAVARATKTPAPISRDDNQGRRHLAQVSCRRSSLGRCVPSTCRRVRSRPSRRR